MSKQLMRRYAVAFGAVAVLVGCSAPEECAGEVPAVEKAVRGYVEAYNSGDVQRYLGSMCPSLRDSRVAKTRSPDRDLKDALVQDGAMALDSITDVHLESSTKATALVQIRYANDEKNGGTGAFPQKQVFIKDGDRWMICTGKTDE
ncbi:Rv0361 family membrane protein [Mycobacteroides abscessus]|uniref:Rv0361 family membrane protein n=1 Tax=Mycobacteroides abscessus TaxID=36809 RepID=UPI000942F824|nr:hypothetical protein [Mycobacteroides abscessus]